MIKIAIIAMSAKPYHAGHDALIRLAADECDEVHLYVSLSDRKRSGEALILGSDMAKLWHDKIEATLPDNVDVRYLSKGSSPIGAVWSELGEANEKGSLDDYVVYADPEDIDVNFSVDKLQRYVAGLFESGQLTTRPVDRESTVDISGTQMREYLATDDKEHFVAGLPPTLDADTIWYTLRKTITDPPKGIKTTSASKSRPKTEVLLRSYVRLVMKD